MIARLLGCTLLLTAVAVPASAQCVTRVRTFYTAPYVTPYVAPIVAVPVVAAVFTPLVVASVPAYSATYGGHDQGTQALLAELKAMRQELQSLRQGANPQVGSVEPFKAPAKGGDEAEFGAILSARCAACHTGGNAKGGFALFAAPGQSGQLTPGQIGKAMIQVQQGTMPPNKALADKEFSQVNLGFARLLTQAAK